MSFPLIAYNLFGNQIEAEVIEEEENERMDKEIHRGANAKGSKPGVPLTHRDPGGGIHSFLPSKIKAACLQGIEWFWTGLGYVIIIGFVGFIAYASFEEPINEFFGYDKKTSNNDEYRYDYPDTPPRAKPTQFSAPAQTTPSTGVYRVYSSSERLAPFKITTPSGSNYFIRLVSQSSGSPAIDIFVRGGNTVEVEVPLGSFVVKYAAGDIWYGPEHYFGPRTAYSETNTVFDFRLENGYYSGYTLTLQRVRDGNLSSKSIGAGDF